MSSPTCPASDDASTATTTEATRKPRDPCQPDTESVDSSDTETKVESDDSEAGGEGDLHVEPEEQEEHEEQEYFIPPVATPDGGYRYEFADSSDEETRVNWEDEEEAAGSRPVAAPRDVDTVGASRKLDRCWWKELGMHQLLVHISTYVCKPAPDATGLSRQYTGAGAGGGERTPESALERALL
ncbi:hypothetical protein OH77DRAFT_1438585 [Trametes cingulata]|nr:hypothetical protein OH77DRAFT_1438585 [Trametes cingulata]